MTFRLSLVGLTNRQLRELVAPLLDMPEDAHDSARNTYDLRPLLLRGLIERIPGAHRYRVTDTGLRIALCYSRANRRAPVPALSPFSTSGRHQFWDDLLSV